MRILSRLLMLVSMLLLVGCDDSSAQMGTDGPVVAAHDAATNSEGDGSTIAVVDTNAAGDSASTGDAAGDTASGVDAAPVMLEIGLIGHWKFDEGSGTHVGDSSGNGNHGTVLEGEGFADAVINSVVNPTPKWATGKIGGAIELDGNDDWVRVPDSDSLDSTATNQAVSVTVWLNAFKLDTVGVTTFVRRHKTDTRIVHFALSTHWAQLRSEIHFYSADSPDYLTPPQWRHIGMTYDGINLRAYLDGKQNSHLVLESPFFKDWQITADRTPLSIGAGIAEDDVIDHFTGLVDEVRLYNRALTPAEVKVLAEM